MDLRSLNAFLETIINKLSATSQLRLFGITKVPLLFLTNPRIARLDTTSCELILPLNYLTRNHVGSMYFGSMAIGADAVVGLLALHIAKEKQPKKVTIIFKNFKADFLKRSEEDVVFKCNAGEQIRAMVDQTLASNARVTETIKISAFVKSSDDPVAHFELGLSLKPS